MPITGRDQSPNGDTRTMSANDDEHRLDEEAERLAGHWPAAAGNFWRARELSEQGRQA